jgi:hypothetical protein
MRGQMAEQNPTRGVFHHHQHAVSRESYLFPQVTCPAPGRARFFAGRARSRTGCFGARYFAPSISRTPRKAI